MRLRTITVSVIAAALALVPLAGVAFAWPDDRECPDYASQAEAQEALDAQLNEPERLDADGDGVACEDFDYGSAAPTTTPAAPTPTPAPDDDAGEAPPAEQPPADDDADVTPPAEQPPADDDADVTPPATQPADDDEDQVTVIPRGGVDTGDGSSGDTPAPLLIGAVVALGAVTAAARRRAHAAR